MTLFVTLFRSPCFSNSNILNFFKESCSNILFRVCSLLSVCCLLFVFLLVHILFRVCSCDIKELQIFMYTVYMCMHKWHLPTSSFVSIPIPHSTCQLRGGVGQLCMLGTYLHVLHVIIHILYGSMNSKLVS